MTGAGGDLRGGAADLGGRRPADPHQDVAALLASAGGRRDRRTSPRWRRASARTPTASTPT
jgi:hypothetical protein